MEARNITLRFGGLEALNGLSFAVDPGQIVSLIGPNGAGKTTLLNVITGVYSLDSGEILFRGSPISRLRTYQIAGLGIHRTFQQSQLFHDLTALENVALPTIFSTNSAREKGYERAEELMEMVGLKEKITAYPRQLSAGQQQRLVVARALLNQPEVLLADEPTSDLDEQTETEIMELFKGIHDRSGITIVLVTHSSGLVSYGTRSVKMAAGRILEES